MFEKLLSPAELAEFKTYLRVLNTYMENCALGNKDSCVLANQQYNKILSWKKNKMSEKIKETDMENMNNLSFSSQPLNTGKFVQTPRKPTFFQAVNSLGACNYSVPLTGQNVIPFEGLVKAVPNFVGAPPTEDPVDKAVKDIGVMLAAFDVEIEEGGKPVSGFTVGKSWWKKVTEKIKVPTMSDIKREVKQALDPRHMAEQFKKVTQKNLEELRDWGKRILKNPGELLHPPLPKTGNKTIDKEIIGKIEKMAKKVDPGWQIGDVIEKYVVDPSLEVTKEIIDEMRGKKKTEAGKYASEVSSFINSYDSDMRRKLDNILINNPLVPAQEEREIRKGFSEVKEKISREFLAIGADKRDKEKAQRKIEEVAKKQKRSVKQLVEEAMTERYYKVFEELSKIMMKNAGLGRSADWDRPGILDTIKEGAGQISAKQEIFKDLFAKIKNKKNTGIFEGSCGPDSKQIGTKKIGGKEYVICKSIKPKPKIVWKEKYVYLHGTVGKVINKPKLLLLIDFLNKLKRMKSARDVEDLTADYKAALAKLEANIGIFQGGCGIHSNRKGSVTIDDEEYALCQVVPGERKTKTKYKKIYTKRGRRGGSRRASSRTRGVSGVTSGLEIGNCPTCMIEELTLGGSGGPFQYSDFYKLAGIKHFSGNTMTGRQITKM